MHGAWKGAGLGAGVSGDGFMLSQFASAVHSSWSCLYAHWVSPGDWVGGWEDLQGRGSPFAVFILSVSEAEPTHPTPVSQLTWDAVSIYPLKLRLGLLPVSLSLSVSWSRWL